MKFTILTFGFILLMSIKLWGFTELDTVRVRQDQLLVLKDSIYAPSTDTLIFIPKGTQYKLRKNPYPTSDKFYQTMKQKTGNNQVSAKLFSLLFVTGDVRDKDETPENLAGDTPFFPYEGAIIRKIEIHHVPIIEGSVIDTLRSTYSYIAKVANGIHIKTWDQNIRNNMVVQENQTLDAYKLADSERLVRRLDYIENVKIYVTPTDEDDRVDLIIAVKDRIEWGAGIDANAINNYTLSAYNRNVIGSGVDLNMDYYRSLNQAQTNGYSIGLSGQNIKKFIFNWELRHTNQAFREETGFSFQRDFYTPEIKYAGGLEAYAIRDSTMVLDGIQIKTDHYDLRTQDLWFGRSVKFSAFNDRTFVVFAARYLNNKFVEQPFVSHDSGNLYYNRHILLGQLTISRQKYLRSNYIASFGIYEDIPTGYRISLISGFDFNQFDTRYYMGNNFNLSLYLQGLGYLIVRQESGRFFVPGGEGSMRFDLGYFTPLFTLGRYKVRQFFNSSFIRGFNQPSTRQAFIGLRHRDIPDTYGLGNTINSFSYETVVFTPWYFYGFRFAPYLYTASGKVSDQRTEIEVNDKFTSVGLGFRMRNESLVFNTIEVRYSRFLSRAELMNPNQFSFSFSIPILYRNFFSYKPTLTNFR